MIYKRILAVSFAAALALFHGSASTLRAADDASTPASPTVVVKQTFVCKTDGMNEKTLTISNNCKRVAFLVTGAESHKKKVIVDGRESKEYPGFVVAPCFSPDSKHVVYTVLRGTVVLDGVEGKAYGTVGHPIFSPDSAHVAYSASGNGRFIVVDGKEYNNPCYRMGGMEWSPGSNAVIYYDSRRENDGSLEDPLVVVNGTVQKGVVRLCYSPNGKKIAYVTRLPGEKVNIGGETFTTQGDIAFTIDGVADAAYKEIREVVWSADSSRVVYAAQIIGPIGGQKWCVISRKVGAKGEADQGYENVGNIALSPDGKSIAYVVVKGVGEQTVALNGTLGKSHAVIEKGPFFSPDSKRCFYVARDGEKRAIVADNAESNAYDAVNAMIISPDSTRLASIMKMDNKQMVVVEGKEEARYDSVWYLAFSPDSKRVAYAAKKGNKWMSVIDGENGAEYEQIQGLAFSPDSKHVAFIAQKGNRWVNVIDGIESGDYSGNLNAARIVWDTPTRCHTLVRKDNKILLVECEIKAP